VLHAEQLSPSAVTSCCAICDDESTSGADDDVTVGRKSIAKYACVDCGGDRMCTDCAGAHRKQRLSRGHQLVELNSDSEAATKSSISFCVSHPLQPIIAYCHDCEKALCEKCVSVGGLNTGRGTCRHSACCDLSTAAHTSRARLEEDEQV